MDELEATARDGARGMERNIARLQHRAAKAEHLAAQTTDALGKEVEAAKEREHSALQSL